VPEDQAKQLYLLGRPAPAPFGRGERTLLDRRVRDTQEVPKSRFKIDKSIPGSAIDVTTPPGEVHGLLAAEPPLPEASATYQLRCQVPRYDAAALLNLHAHCREAGPTWRRAVAEFADYVVHLISLWPR
jgi:hypothetical protein